MSQSVEILKEDISDLKGLILKYDEVLVSSNSEIDLFKKNIQIENVYQEIDDALSDIEDGISRTLTISAGLKTFSRVNEASIKPASIHENLESTLNLMKHEFAEKGISVEKIYTASLDEIECNSGKLNQVFMNIFTNSVYAIQHSLNKEKGVISISTKSDKDYLVISIKDNGVGMSEETQDKLFDPFYTTKDVGEGTGLGMSIVLGIIEEHHAKIHVFSNLGLGTEIRIELPYKRK